MLYKQQSAVTEILLCKHVHVFRLIAREKFHKYKIFRILNVLFLGSRTPYSAHAVICNKRFTHFDDDDDDDDDDDASCSSDWGWTSQLRTQFKH